jgi:hypothetical protein
MQESMKARRDRKRRAQVLSLWLRRPPAKRTGSDVLMFYSELFTSRPELLKQGEGDPYQQLKVDLHGHIEG